MIRTGLLPKSRRDGLAAGEAGTLEAQLRDLGHPLVCLLQGLDTNVFVADPELRMIWMNQRAAQTLRQLEPAIRSVFGVSVADMLGGSIHRFHRNPERVEQLLHAPGALPHHADFTFGPVTLRTRVSAVEGTGGGRLGYVVVWDDITERVRDYRDFEAAMGRLSATADHITQDMGSSTDRASSVAAATEELRASVAEIARWSADTATQIRQAVNTTAVGRDRLVDLQRASNEIGDFLRLITSVAEQTKLLALNATIEAARAGAAGKGFAVVAEEVKQLASATSDSITDIEARIQAIRQAADAGSSTLSEISTIIDQVRESQVAVVAATEEQSAVAGDIAQAVTQIADDVQATAHETDSIRNAVNDVTARTSKITGGD